MKPSTTRNGYDINFEKSGGVWRAFVYNGIAAATGKTKREAHQNFTHEWNRRTKATDFYFKAIDRLIDRRLGRYALLEDKVSYWFDAQKGVFTWIEPTKS